MKTPILITVLLFAMPAAAGTRIQVENVDLASNSSRETVMLLDATRFRVNDRDSAMIFLTDGGRDRVLMLDGKRNEYTEMDKQSMDRLGQQMKGMTAQMEAAMKNMPPQQRAMMEQMMKGQMPQAGGAPARVRTAWTAAGSDKVNGIACTRYIGMRGGEKVAEVCAAEPGALKLSPADYQVFEKMREFMSGLADAMKDMPMAPAAEAHMADSGIKGFPVRRTKFRGGKATEREQLKAITKASLTDADFSTGSARKVEMGR